MPALFHLAAHARVVTGSLRHDGVGFLSLWPRVVYHVPGWLAGIDAHLLYSLARRGPCAGAIVEIGSAWGRSTIVLASGSRRARREMVYAIDPHTGDPWYLGHDEAAGRWWRRALRRLGADDPAAHWPGPGSRFSSLPAFRHNLRAFGVDDWVVPVVETSTEAARRLPTGPVRLLYIDGLHTDAAVRADIEDWVPRVVAGGVIVFDDYFTDRADTGVRPAVDALRASGWVEPTLGRVNGGHLVWLTKR
jgi:MMP 1-O-methyltransferase